MKVWAKGIRHLKSIRKLNKRGNRDLRDIEYNIKKLKFEFRHYHIALSEMRGTPRDQIEKPRKNNKPNEKYIERIKDELPESRSAA